MKRLVTTATLLVAGVAAAQPAPDQAPVLPKVGDTLPPNGAPGWPDKVAWLYDAPSFTDSAGRIVIHWFCAPKIATCPDDLARIITLKEQNPRVYIVAYLNTASKRDAEKLDPIRGSEGVGFGTVGYGAAVQKMFKQLSLTGPASFVTDVDGKVSLITTGSSPPELDARDSKVNALAAAIKEYSASSEGPKTAKPNEKFTLSMTIKLASWLHVSKKSGTRNEFQLTVVPKDIKCDATKLDASKLAIADQTLTAKVSCSGPAGSYEMRGIINFGYDTPAKATGVGTDGATWKIEIKN